MLHHSFHHKQV